jgi:hypothetical protein
MCPVLPGEALVGSAQLVFWFVSLVSTLVGCLWMARG